MRSRVDSSAVAELREMYIAQQIAFSHGGTRDVRSADGTTFVLRLPRLPPNHPGRAS